MFRPMTRRKKDSAGEVVKETTVSFVGGLVFTLIFAVAVPLVCNYFIQPAVEDAVGDTAFMWFSSSLIVAVIMLAVMILFSLLLGGGAIMRRFGWVGVAALIFAYYLLGNLPGAIIPVFCIVVMMALEGRKGRKGRRKKKRSVRPFRSVLFYRPRI